MNTRTSCKKKVNFKDKKYLNLHILKLLYLNDIPNLDEYLGKKRFFD